MNYWWNVEVQVLVRDKLLYLSLLGWSAYPSFLFLFLDLCSPLSVVGRFSLVLCCFWLREWIYNVIIYIADRQKMLFTIWYCCLCTSDVVANKKCLGYSMPEALVIYSIWKRDTRLSKRCLMSDERERFGESLQAVIRI